MRKNSLSKCIVFVIVLLVISITGNSQEKSTLQKDKIKIDGLLYHVEWSSRELNVFNINDQPVFRRETTGPEEAILGFDYSPCFNSFVVFKERFDHLGKVYELVLEGSDFTQPIFEDSKEPFYTPIILEDHQKKLILFITESFSIKIYDLNKSLFVGEVKFSYPIYNLSKNSETHSVQFLLFDQGIYKTHFIKIDDVFKNNFQVFPVVPERDDEKEKRVKSKLNFDYETLVGFGDSITKGWVNRIMRPDLGYIPRLEKLLNLEFDRGLVINMGIGAETTDEALLRFEYTILSQRGKYLLFHEGINDVAKNVLPVSVVVYNINYMINTALDYGIIPIASTLIPRDPAHDSGQGIKRQRAIDVSEGVRLMASDLGISFVDFWEIFSNYPESDGGYYSLMSDYVHPSKKGYQLMAEEWFKNFKALVPQTPGNIEFLSQSPRKITVQWSENMEMDFSFYRINFGYSFENLGREILTSTNNFTFIQFFIHSLFFNRVYLKIQAVDISGNASDFSPVNVAEFKTQNQVSYERMKNFSTIIKIFIF